MAKYITPEGLKKIKKELDYLKNVERKRISQRLKKAVAYGDLSENADYSQAREDQNIVEQRIAYLENIIKNSVVVNKKSSLGYVQIGSKVKVKNGSKILDLEIVGTQESDPSKGKISCESPIGKALINKREGEIVSVKLAKGEVKYKILKIE